MLFKLYWHHWLNGHEFEQTLRDSEGQGSLACCSPWVSKEPDTTEWVNNNLIKYNRWKKWLKIYMPKCQQHIFLMGVIIIYLFPYHGGSDGKESACNVGDLGSIPGSGRSLEKGIATYSSILAWRILWTEEPGGATVHVVSKSQTQQKRLTLSLFIISFYFPNFL